MDWDDEQLVLQGTVWASSGHFYEAAVSLAAGPDGGPEFDHGQRSCPVGVDCKHTVTLALAAAGGRGHHR